LGQVKATFLEGGFLHAMTNGHLTVLLTEKSLTRKDEIGGICRAMKLMITNLTEIGFKQKK